MYTWYVFSHMGDTFERDRKIAPQERDLPKMIQHREFLTVIQRLTDAGIWAYRPTTKETWWSKRAKDLCGIDDEEMPSFTDVMSRRTKANETDLMDAFNKAIKDNTSFNIRTEFIHEDRARQVAQICCEPHSMDEDSVVLFGVIQDVTDEIRKEQRIKVLRQTSQQLKRANSRQAVAEIMADASKNILGLVNTTIRLTDRNGDTLQTIIATEECVERAGKRPDYSISEATPAARTYRNGEPELHTDHEMTDDEYDRGELQSGLYAPIENHGVLSAGDVTINAFDEQDLEAASLLGQLGAEAITRIGLAKRSRAI